MESAFFAIAETEGLAPAFKIIQAIVNAAQFSIPLSQMMYVGCVKALNRFFFDTSSDSDEEFYGAVDNMHDCIIPVYHERKTIHTEPYIVQKATSLTFYNLQLYGNFLDSFNLICQSIRDAVTYTTHSINLVSGRNIGEMYPISKAITSTTQEATNNSAHDIF